MCRSEFVPTLGGGRIVRTGTDLFHIFNLYPSLTGQMYDAHCRYFMIYYLLFLRKFVMTPLLFNCQLYMLTIKFLCYIIMTLFKTTYYDPHRHMLQNQDI